MRIEKSSTILETAIEAAQRAGQVIVERYSAGHTFTVKGYRDVSTEVDTAAEAIIMGLVRDRFPGHAILSEEAGGSPIGDGFTWVVDPLDGTTNYAHRLPVFATSIGVLQGGAPLVGVIYDPLREHMFIAEQGGGARLNGAPLRVSRVSDLGQAAVGTDWGYDDELREQVLASLHRISPRCGTVRTLGSATLALAYVAAGWLDCYFHLKLSPWDAAAGMLLINEAGGRVSTPAGGPYRVDLPGCLATNGLLHDEMLALLSPRRHAGHAEKTG